MKTCTELVGKIVFGTFYDDESEGDGCGWFYLGKNKVKEDFCFSLSDLWIGHRVIGNIHDNPELLEV